MCAVVWSPDGRAIAYSDPGTHGGIGVLHVGGTSRLMASRPFCALPTMPAFSPDSRFLSYQANVVAGTGDGYRLAVVDLSTRHIVLRSPRRLGAVDRPAWSPNGSKLVVARYRQPGGSAVWLYVGDVRTRRWRLFRPCPSVR